ncbi:hypothetical protein NRB56_41990 [Nocardia sp. RB56]|uniref:HicB family toxin-antitoxin system n=1 Tax=Nocardia aurantia TaxID=2585199 RepID=A0A7K0DS74_9NOCA|nr:hypothetical protein [Nocardia aurantia]
MKYTAHVTGREGRWWSVEIPVLGAEAQTQARRLTDVEAEARDYISVALDIVPSTIEVEVVIGDIGRAHDVQRRSERIRAARAEAQRLEQEAQRETQSLAGELAAEKIPVRDIATLVGTTFQRVGQLVSGSAAGRSPEAG